MTSELRVDPREVAAFEFAAHNCFACGTLNPGGLQMPLHVEPGRCWSKFTLDARFEGWEGIAHGGIVSTILDEVMAWALVGGDDLGVTARLSVSFHQPVPLGIPIRAEGWITRERRRVFETAGHLVDATTGVELATASATYVAANALQKTELQKRYGFRYLTQFDDPRTERGDT